MNNTTPPIFVKVKTNAKSKKKRARGFSYWEISTFEIRRTGICWLLPTLVVAWIFEKVVRVWEWLDRLTDDHLEPFDNAVCVLGGVYSAHTPCIVQYACVCVYTTWLLALDFDRYIYSFPPQPLTNQNQLLAIGLRCVHGAWLSYLIEYSPVDSTGPPTSIFYPLDRPNRLLAPTTLCACCGDFASVSHRFQRWPSYLECFTISQVAQSEISGDAAAHRSVLVSSSGAHHSFPRKEKSEHNQPCRRPPRTSSARWPVWERDSATASAGWPVSFPAHVLHPADVSSFLFAFQLWPRRTGPSAAPDLRPGLSILQIFVTQPSKLTQNYCRLSHLGYRKEHAGLKRGKAGFSDEYLDKLDSETRDSLQENGDAAGEGEPDLRWERLRLSDGDLLGASRDPDFEKLKVINYYTQRWIPSPIIIDYHRVLAEPIPVWAATMPALKTAEWPQQSVGSKSFCDVARNHLRLTSNSGQNRKCIATTTRSTSAGPASCPALLPSIWNRPSRFAARKDTQPSG